MTRPLTFTAARRAIVAAALVIFTGAAAAEDLLQIYREAQRQDPALASARSLWEATQERVPQARSALLPQLSAAGQANANSYDGTLNTSPSINTSQQYGLGNLTFSASQALYRPAYVVALDQAREQVTQSDSTLGLAQQDLILRTAVVYFDVLLAEFNVELAGQQKLAVAEQLAQAKRNFEVGTATITDTNEAQARYDSIVATEIQARNDLERRRTALAAIIGRAPKALVRLGRGFEPPLPEPNNVDYWVERARQENLQIRVARSNYDIASLEVDRARTGHLPTLDLVASAGAQASSGSPTTNFSGNSRTALFGVVVNVPIYQGGFVSSKVREAISLQDKSRADLETATRQAVQNAQDGFYGINSAAAGVKAFEQAVASAEVALQSNILGQEVGIRTNLDVLNVRQNVFQTRRDLANAYFQYLLAVLRLKAAVGSLNERDVEDLNRRLNG
ncbi:MAG: TolC family outer membrane protein [Burkholderiales bacterium]|nr:TolC family outer membrane protein [Burkholderiales bacterium]